MANNWGIGETTSQIRGADRNDGRFYGLFPVPRNGDLNNSRQQDMEGLTAGPITFKAEDPPPAVEPEHLLPERAGPAHVPAELLDHARAQLARVLSAGHGSVAAPLTSAGP